MTSIWKSVWSAPMNLLGRLRHKKLAEEWVGIQQPVLEGITFYAKYLGSTLVEEPSGDKATADAIRAIIGMAKASGKKLAKVALTVSPKGISTRDVATGELQLDVSIYRISFCSADASFDRVVAFIATHSNEVMECHAFLTAKRKVAQAAALTISQAFQVAYTLWQSVQEDAKVETADQPDAAGRTTPLIDLSADTGGFGRLSPGASQPQVYHSGLGPQEEEELRRFVASGDCSREGALKALDPEDDLLTL